MGKFIALLRGINVGGHKKIKMADLRTHLTAIGCDTVETYIQSGNVVFEHLDGDPSALAKAIKDKLQAVYGFEVPTIVIAAETLKNIFDHCPFEEEIKAQSYFTILESIPAETAIVALNTTAFSDVEFMVTTQCVYFYSEKKTAQIKLNNNVIERVLCVTATTRNYRTLKRLNEMAS